MKTLLSTIAALVVALGLTGCSTTNDRGVNINRSTDIFGAVAAPSAGVVTPVSASTVAPVAKS
jgi:hypothetical protein